MVELSLHILDIVQNSLHANATGIAIVVDDNLKENTYCITITDNGSGMDEETIVKVLDPFYTSKNKKTGMGIPLFKQHAELCGGNLEIDSQLGKGTAITAIFENNHFDRQPMGDIASTIAGIIRSNPDVRLIYSHKVDGEIFELDTNELKQELDGVPIESPDVISFIKEMIKSNIDELESNRNISKKQIINNA